MKKEGDSFRVITEAYDGAEVYELIGIYMLYLIGKKYSSKNIGLYRDNGLPYSKSQEDQLQKKIKKQLQYFFKQKKFANNCIVYFENRARIYL